jgi:hypothetical protein
MATSSFFMGSMGGAYDEPSYLFKPRRRSHGRLSLVTVAVTGGVAVSVSVLVCAVCFMHGGGAMLDMQQRYGAPQCPAPGRKSFSEPVVNFSPCCLHYPATCCAAPCEQEEAGEAAICRRMERIDDSDEASGGDMAWVDEASRTARVGGAVPAAGGRHLAHRDDLPNQDAAMPTAAGISGRVNAGKLDLWAEDASAPVRKHKGIGGGDACGRLVTDACAEKRNLLACARCSPFAGHFQSSAGRNSTLTVCASFCRELWGACRLESDAGADSDAPIAFCAGLGVDVALANEPHCFAAAPRSVAGPRGWQAGMVLLVAAWGARAAAARGGAGW